MKVITSQQAVVVHTLNPNTQEATLGDCGFEGSLVYRGSSRTDRDTQRDSVLKTQTKQNRAEEQLQAVHTNEFCVPQSTKYLPPDIQKKQTNTTLN